MSEYINRDVPSVVILLATYNGEMYLREQLDSLLQQGTDCFTVFIRDDGSTDRTLEIISEYCTKYPDRFIHIVDKLGNLGSSSCFMHLLSLADSYDYIMFCDQDDVWLPNKVTLSLAGIQELEEKFGRDVPLLCFSDLQVVDQHLNEIDSSFWASQRLDPNITKDWYRLLAQNVVTGCTMIINRAAREVSLPFVLTEMVHDQWIAVNVSKIGSVGYLSQPTMLYRQHGRNVVGAHKNIAYYLTCKIADFLDIVRFYIKASRHFKEVGVIRLFWYKVMINVRRLI